MTRKFTTDEIRDAILEAGKGASGDPALRAIAMMLFNDRIGDLR